MVYRFYTSPLFARKLTKESRKRNFYFRTLTRTDTKSEVYCEITEKGKNLINPQMWEMLKIE